MTQDALVFIVDIQLNVRLNIMYREWPIVHQFIQLNCNNTASLLKRVSHLATFVAATSLPYHNSPSNVSCCTNEAN